jgi:hypothetical protein
MSDAEIMHPEHFDIIAEDPSHAFAADMGLELLEFCITQLENELADNNQEMEDLNEDKLRVSCFLLRTSQNLPLHWLQLAEWEADHHVEADLYNLADSEAPEDNLPEIEAARELFVNDGTEGSELDSNSSASIEEIVAACLKDIKKLKTPHSIKMVTQLTAVAEYVKVRCKYVICKRPCLNASLAVARRMGKGPYFACQIRQNEAYLIQYKRLPPTKAGAFRSQYSLLENNTIRQSVRVYLAIQKLGEITPKELCRHVNSVILPAMNLTGKDGSICERTAIRWLIKLGYTCKDVKKGLYHDGHERPDVIKDRDIYVDRLFGYER